MRKIYALFLLLACVFNYTVTAQSNPTAQPVPYTQDFSGLAHSSTTYPAGWQGWSLSSAPSSSFNTAAPSADRNLIASSTAIVNSGNVHNYNGKIGFLNNGSIDFSLALAVNTTGNSNVQVTYDIMTIRNPADGTATNNRINEVTLQYRVGTSGAFTTLTGVEYQNNLVGQTTAITTPQNLANKTITLPAACNNQAVVQLRWVSRQVSGAGSRPSFAVDNISVGNGGADTNPPLVTAFTPADNATDVSRNTNLVITFNEAIQKGTAGNITIKKTSDNSIVQTIAVTNAAVTVATNTATVTINALDYSTGYYVEVDAAAFEDIAGNDFAGISGNSTWNFTTGAAIYIANYNTCTSALSDGFTAYSAVGAQVWACTTFGRDAANMPSGSAPNGVQINGFSGTNIPNEDWLISPALNLTGTAFPLLSYYSRTKFNGAPLQLKVSVDYPGTGDPRNFTWTDLDGRFPGQTSDVWTLSSNINLAAYKTANTYIAFVYHSTADDGARWTLDDVRIDNSLTPPPPVITASTTDLEFGFVAAASTGVKTITFTGNDLAAGMTLTATGNFLISKTNGGFAPSITYTQAEANNLAQTLFVQFAPTAINQTYTGTITISSAGATDVVINTRGNSLDTATTLEVVNWNIEWFGSTSNGPTNDNLQEQNVRTILQSIKADIFGLAEVVSEARLASVVSQMPGYSYVISNYGSHTNTTVNPPSSLAEAQKLAFVYRTDIFSNISTAPLVSAGINTAADITNPAYNYFASGRFPYMFTANATLNGITKTVRFVLIHGKANTSPTATSYARRKSGSDTLRYTLNNLYPNDNVVILGDFNDDLDVTITDGITPNTTSYVAFTTDNTNFSLPTLPLSLAGKKSTVSYNDVIDHVVLSNDMQCSYVASSAAILTDVTGLVSNYANTTTDHYPVFTRYLFNSQSATISYAASPYCQNAGTATVTQTGTAGGTYTSTTGLVIDATTGTVNLATSTAGTYTVTYSIAATGVCNPAFSTTATITINAGPTATISYAASPYCQNAGTATVTRTGTAGGTYSSTTGLTIDAATGTITTATSTAGTYTVTYTIAAANGCAAFTTTATVTITAAPAATISYAGSPYCQTAANATVTRTGTAGGSYSSTTGLIIDATTGTITTATSTAGTYTVTYTIAAANGCAAFSTTTTVTITAAPAATISYPGSPFCQNAGTVPVTGTGTTGGTYSSTTGLSINTATGTITTATSTPGTYNVTYTIAAANGCAAFSTTTQVTISVAPAATISYAASPYCQTAATATVIRTGTVGGTYSSTTGLTIDATTGTITPSTSTAGTYTVTYTIAAANGCAVYTTTTTVSITLSPTATISYSGSPYCGTGTANVTRTGSAGGAYSSTAGLSIDATTGAINLAASTAGTYTVTYSIAASGGCAAFSTTASVTINTASVAPTGAISSVTTSCGPATVNLSVQGGTAGTGASWKWYSSSCGGTAVGTGATLSNIIVNSTTTFYVRAEGTCNNTACASVTVTINPQPTISLTAAPYTALLPGMTTTITANIAPVAAGNTITWTRNGNTVSGATGNSISVDVDRLGTYTARVTTVNGCTALSAPIVIRDSANDKLFISPNPNNGQFTIRYYSNAQNFGFLRYVTIYDSKGAKIFSRQLPVTAPFSGMNIDIRQRGKGWYYVVVGDHNGKPLASGSVEVL